MAKFRVTKPYCIGAGKNVFPGDVIALPDSPAGKAVAKNKIAMGYLEPVKKPAEKAAEEHREPEVMVEVVTEDGEETEDDHPDAGGPEAVADRDPRPAKAKGRGGKGPKRK